MERYFSSQMHYKFSGRKVILYIRERVCETPDELLASELFFDVLRRAVAALKRCESPLLELFQPAAGDPIPDQELQQLTVILRWLAKLPLEQVRKLVEAEQAHLIAQPALLYDFVEYLYDYWREFERFLICDSEGDALDQRPYRTFNRTIESLTHLVRSVYRDIQENISGQHPNIYRQTVAGAEIAAIALPKPLFTLSEDLQQLNPIPVIRQVLMYPPLLLNPPMNKRSGQFVQTQMNPLSSLTFDPGEWLCYPAKVGPLFIPIYFQEQFYELGFTLCNLFELAEDDFLRRPPDAVLLFGVPEESLDPNAAYPTVFYHHSEEDIWIGAIPRRKEFGYFGYMKKMALTLHNVVMMHRGRLPFHGAMVQILLRNGREFNLLIIGDTGAGKSETLEAFRNIGEDLIRTMTIIADDMGSLEIQNDGEVIAYGTEVGAFVRLDDLSPGFAFGRLDRTIIMNPSQTNARVVLPVTTYANIIRGAKVDMVLYANNYEAVDAAHPLIERFDTVEQALTVFRAGKSMSKGTTTSSGLVQTYFANVFGAIQFQPLHETLAGRFFQTFFERGIFVGQLRTRLGIAGWERRGPEEAARALLEWLG
ncbi:MAG: phosphoenolpyruvate carboxykinase [Anaerolineales bacterium]